MRYTDAPAPHAHVRVPAAPVDPAPQHTPLPVPTPRDVFGDAWPEDDGPDEPEGLDKVRLGAVIARGLVNDAMETLPDLRHAEPDENLRVEYWYAEGLAAQAWQQLQKIITTIDGLQKKAKKP